jgi:hypothetical protein
MKAEFSMDRKKTQMVAYKVSGQNRIGLRRNFCSQPPPEVASQRSGTDGTRTFFGTHRELWIGRNPAQKLFGYIVGEVFRNFHPKLDQLLVAFCQLWHPVYLLRYISADILGTMCINTRIDLGSYDTSV